jgi:hypothetical protein
MGSDLKVSLPIFLPASLNSPAKIFSVIQTLSWSMPGLRDRHVVCAYSFGRFLESFCRRSFPFVFSAQSDTHDLKAGSKRCCTMEIVCRKRTETEVWHICVDCTAWPTRNYTEKWVELTSIDHDTICIQCLQRKREGKCRMCGPDEMYDLEISSAKLRLVDRRTRYRPGLKSLVPLLLSSVSRKKD